MTKIILAIALTLGALQAGDVVHYDTKDSEKPAMSKPNHPSTDLYSKKSAMNKPNHPSTSLYTKK